MVQVEPMTEVYCEIKLLLLRYFKQMFILVYVDCYEFIADEGCMLRGINQAKGILTNQFCEPKFLVQVNSFAFNSLSPADVVETLPKEDNVGTSHFEECFIYVLTHCVEVESKYFIHQHVIAIGFRQSYVIPQPLGLVL